FSPMQLRDTLAAALAKYIATPMISVIVREVHSFKVSVIGEVKTPGRYELRSRTTVLDVLAMAGGLSQYASRGRITILRRDGNALRDLPYDFEKIAARAGPRASGQENFCVQPGDIVVVPCPPTPSIPRSTPGAAANGSRSPSSPPRAQWPAPWRY